MSEPNRQAHEFYVEWFPNDRAEVEFDGQRYVPADWHGLMSILDSVYPATIFTGDSPDPGPQIVAHLREIDRLRG